MRNLVLILVSLVCLSCASVAQGAVLLGDSSLETNPDSNVAGNPQAFSFVALSSGSVSSISVYVDAGNTATSLKLGLYSNSAGHPGSLLTNGTLTAPQAGAWNTITVSAKNITGGTTYWIAGLGVGGQWGFRDRVAGNCTTEVSAAGSRTTLMNNWQRGQQWTNQYCPASVFMSSSGAATKPSNTSAPTVSGTAQQDDTLTASPGSWTGSGPISYAYQWQQDGSTNIPGATSSTYTIQASDVGHTLDVNVTASNSAGSASAASSQTATVIASTSPNGQPVGDPLGKTWTQGFDDEFNGTTIDQSRWGELSGWGLANGTVTNPADCSESGGNGVLAVPGDGTGCALTSVPSVASGGTTGGWTLNVGDYFEARVYDPGPGSTPTATIYNWPVVWALGVPPNGGSGEPAGEIDVAEGLNNLQVNYHWDDASGGGNEFVAAPAGNWGNSWHVYGVYRGATQDQIFYDGNLVATVTTHDNGQPEMVMLNSGQNSCCGAPNGFGSVGNMLVDWVRGYQ